MTTRLPNPFVPHEVRRSIGGLRDESSDHTDDISVLQVDVDAAEAEIVILDGRVDDLEAASDAALEAEAVDDISSGMPVYGVAGFPKVGLARSDTQAKSRVAGIAVVDSATGFTSTYAAGGRVTLDDWTAAVGAVTLTPSSVYFLADTGGITDTAPTAVGKMVTEIGQAVEADTLELNIKRPILL